MRSQKHRSNCMTEFFLLGWMLLNRIFAHSILTHTVVYVKKHNNTTQRSDICLKKEKHGLGWLDCVMNTLIHIRSLANQTYAYTHTIHKYNLTLSLTHSWAQSTLCSSLLDAVFVVILILAFSVTVANLLPLSGLILRRHVYIYVCCCA